ncbi:MAG: FAD:protein FMN transferase [Candidatus Paceibacterota bacterium]|jgi:thiamine biosynthesis lipoprotein
MHNIKNVRIKLDMKEFEYKGKAMGTDFSIAIVCDSKGLADKLADEAEKEIWDYEKLFSRFLPESELSRLNKEKEIVVSETFMKVALASRELFFLTDGIFNPLFQIERLGYDKDFNRLDIISIKKNIEEYNTDFTSTVFDEKESIIILQKGQKLDFGGFLKGYLAEILCKEIKSSSKEIGGVIVNIGGDLYTQGLDANGKEFVFEIYNPITKKDDILISIYNQALATSGTYKRNWKNGNLTIHHILDISGIQNPDTGVVSASIISDSGAKSEAFAKVFISVGPKEAQKILKDDKMKYIIIKSDGKIIKNI